MGRGLLGLVRNLDLWRFWRRLGGFFSSGFLKGRPDGIFWMQLILALALVLEQVVLKKLAASTRAR